jgi:hypothetical protein
MFLKGRGNPAFFMGASTAPVGSKRPSGSIPWRLRYVPAARVGSNAVFASFDKPLIENGNDELMKHECVHQHSLFAMRPRISSAFSENHAFANDQPYSRMLPISHCTSQSDTVPSGFSTPDTDPA